jgi:hypothetical protein
MKAKIHSAQVVYEYKKSYDKYSRLENFDEQQAYYFKQALVKPHCVGMVEHGISFRLIVIDSK